MTELTTLRTRELYDVVRELVAREGFTPELQTRISAFVTAAKNANALFLGMFELAPGLSGASYQLLHAQLFRELEHLTLLARVTRWRAVPSLYGQALKLAGPLWKHVPRARVLRRPRLDERSAFAGFAFGHALLSDVRLSPIIPAQADPADPYAAALRYIDQDNGRMLQAQIRALKSGFQNLRIDEKEAIVAEKREAVGAAFGQFMQWLSQPRSSR